MIRGTIDAPIARDKKERQSMTVDENGKHAVTHFQVLERFKDFTLVECRLETGRTHQIRVHMKYIGYHLQEIKVWTKENIRHEWTSTSRRHFRFDHPRTGEYIQFEAPIPEVFEDALNILRK